MIKTRILIDTDIGDDVDDSLALALTLESNRFDILGITTVFKNVGKRAEIANHLLNVYGQKKIPIFEGIGSPIVNQIDISETPCQYSNDWIINYKKHKTHAVDFILETVKLWPETTIVSIGPLTNLAVAVLKEPDIMRKANILIMGGAFTAATPEWNIVCDPESANIVLNSGANIKMFGLDVTVKCALSKEQLERIEKSSSDKIKLLWDMILAWNKRSGFWVTLHDPLVVVYMLAPELFRFEKKEVDVELNGSLTRGATIVKKNFFNENHMPNIEVCTDVDSEKVIQFFIETILK